jgi:alkylation response protein AidB-like acyl-CoA dehydrogenase
VDGEKFTAFIVERSMGVVSGREEHKLGLDGSSTTALILDNVKVPVENVLGAIGEGHKVAFNTLNLGRVKLGTRNITGAKLALNHAVAYAKERRQFGRAICDFGLIKQKLAEMAVRCYVGDAMVYRVLGDVGRALEAVPSGDSSRVLKTIEAFAVECSINKVWTSETLGYAVDEAVQVFGGNGYSREFPVERAYRDARITRIYEGTNEINRLIIPTRLLKRSAALFTRSHARQVLDEGDSPVTAVGALGAEHTLLASLKRVAVAALGCAAETYGDSIKDEQEVAGYAADMIAEIYAVDSCLARTEKLFARIGQDRSSVAVDIARVYAGDAADRIVHSAKQVVAALAARGGSDEPGLTDLVGRLAARAAIHTIGARRRIADAVIAAGRYPF